MRSQMEEIALKNFAFIKYLYVLLTDIVYEPAGERLHMGRLQKHNYHLYRCCIYM